MQFAELARLIMKREGAIYSQNRFTNYFSKFGISARSHPHIDLRNLTAEQALIIHKEIYDQYKIKDLPPKIRAIVFTAGVMNGFPEAFRLLSQAVDYFPLKESLSPELLSAVELSEIDSARARLGSLLLFFYLDHYGSNCRAVIPRIMESISN